MLVSVVVIASPKKVGAATWLMYQVASRIGEVSGSIGRVGATNITDIWIITPTTKTTGADQARRCRRTSIRRMEIGINAIPKGPLVADRKQTTEPTTIADPRRDVHNITANAPKRRYHCRFARDPRTSLATGCRAMNRAKANLTTRLVMTAIVALNASTATPVTTATADAVRTPAAMFGGKRAAIGARSRGTTWA